MCERASFLALRNGDLYWKLGCDDHSSMITECGIEGNYSYSETPYVQIECVPLTKDPFSTNPKDWEVVVDCYMSPLWFDINEWQDKILDELINKRIPKEKETGILGKLEVTFGAEVSLDWVTSVDALVVLRRAKVSFPNLKTLRALNISTATSCSLPLVESLHYCSALSDTTMHLPLCTHIDEMNLMGIQNTTLPELSSVYDLYLSQGAMLTAPKLTTVHRLRNFSGLLEAPLLRSVEDYNV